MPDVLSIFAQYGLPGAICGAMFVWVWTRDRAHAREIEGLQAQLRDVHTQHKADLKDGAKNLIAAHADIHEVMEKLGRWADAMTIVDEQRGHGPPPPRGGGGRLPR